MAQRELSCLIIQAIDSFHEVERTKVLIQSFWQFVNDANWKGLTEKQDKTLDSAFYCLTLYEQELELWLEELRKDLDCCLRQAVADREANDP